jgi:hypothetical protein
VRSLVLATLLLATGVSVSAAIPARDLFVPIAGRAKNAAGREFLTALWLSNVHRRDAAAVTLTFLPSGVGARSPRQVRLTIPAGATRVLDPLDARLLGSSDAVGAVRVESSTDVLAHARVYAVDGGVSFAAIPARHAIGNTQSATLQGVAGGNTRYRLYLVETAGAALTTVVELRDLDGRMLGEKRLFVDAYQHFRADVRELFADAQPGRATLVIRGFNGNGRVVAMGAHIPPGTEDDPSAFEMSFAPEPRSRIGWPEAAVYIAVAAAIIAALMIRRR